MNFCRLYNKTRVLIDRHLIDLSVPDGQKYEPVKEINIMYGTIVVVWILIYQIPVFPIVCIICLFNWIQEKMVSRCDIETKEETERQPQHS